MVPKEIWPIYIVRVVLPVLAFHLGIIWCAASITDDPFGIFMHHVSTYVPILTVMIAGYSVFLWRYPRYILVTTFFKEKADVKVPTADPKPDIYLQMPFHDILKTTSMGPVMENGSTRFFDIFAVHGKREGRFVLLTNGEKVFADKILQEFEERGLDRWILKISRNYRINMLLVLYTVDTRSRLLRLQQEVYDNLLKNLSPAEIDEIRKIGPAMKNTLVEDFLAKQQSMDAKGWDDFIPLR